MNISKYIYFILSEFLTIIASVSIIPFVFQYMGLLVGIIALVLFIMIFFAIIIIFTMRHAPIETFYDTVKAQGKAQAKYIIIRDKKHPDITWFSAMGELIMTDMGAIFFYGHPFINPRKILIINSLTTDEMSPPFIIIEGIVQFKDGIAYTETTHRLIIGGQPSTYEDLITKISVTDSISKSADAVRKAMSGNPEFIKNKTDKMPLSEFDEGKY